MPHEINFDDILTLAWFALLCRVKVTNKGKDIKKNDSTFELHDQFIESVQESYFFNMFDNYQEIHSDKLDQIHSTQDVVTYVLKMLEFYNVNLYYDPEREVLSEEGVDDLFIYCQVSKL